MKIVKNSIFALLGVFGAFEGFLSLAQASSSMHQIYGGIMVVVLTVCVGFWE